MSTISIAGTIEISTVSPDDVQVKLYRATTDGMEDDAWDSTTPDPTTGNWSFESLSTDTSYYVAIVPPEGYEPKLIGPYKPRQP